MSVSSFFKKRVHNAGNAAASVQMTEAEAALAQSDFNIEKITEIQNKFTGGVVLLVPGRIFIREGQLWKVCRKGPKRRQFFLFNDILVYGSIVAGRYSNQQVLPLAQMSISSECHYQPRVQAEFDVESEQLDQLDVSNAFQISHSNKSFHVFALSAADKANWLANLQKHIGRVSASSQQQHQQQFTARAVWVPDASCRSCMVCGTRFTAFSRKHHCRRCGRVVCGSCSPHRLDISEGAGKLERVCNDCFRELSKTTVEVQWHTATAERDLQSPPPPAVAAQVVSSVLRSHIANSPPRGDGHESTDTEDSDDSANEQEMAPYKSPEPPPKSHDEGEKNSLQVPSSPVEAGQPTPPPRKKKMQKLKQKEKEKVMLDELKKQHTKQTDEITTQQDDPTQQDSTTQQDDPTQQDSTTQQDDPTQQDSAIQQDSLSQQDSTTQQDSLSQDSSSQPSESSLPSQESPQLEPRADSELHSGIPKKMRRKNKYARPEETVQTEENAKPSSPPDEPHKPERNEDNPQPDQPVNNGETSEPSREREHCDFEAEQPAGLEDTDGGPTQATGEVEGQAGGGDEKVDSEHTPGSPEQAHGHKARGRKKRFVKVEDTSA